MAAFGFLNPLLAAFIHVRSESTGILNSTRLLPRTAAAPDIPIYSIGGKSRQHSQPGSFMWRRKLVQRSIT
jgi:hypothetical protein